VSGPRIDHPRRLGDSTEPLLAVLQRILNGLPGLVSDRVELLSLEMQRAGRALAQIVALLVAAAILGVAAWIAAWGGIALALIEGAGLHWGWALAVVLLCNAAAAWIAVARARQLFPRLTLPATRRHLTLGEDGLLAAARPAADFGSQRHDTATPSTAV